MGRYIVNREHAGAPYYFACIELGEHAIILQDYSTRDAGLRRHPAAFWRYDVCVYITRAGARRIRFYTATVRRSMLLPSRHRRQ